MARLDKEGFLLDLADWNEEVAAILARQHDIMLEPEHWEIIHVVRNYYDTYKLSPTTRVLAKVVERELGDGKGRSIYLMRLFSGKPAKVVAKISGLPKPANCD